MKKKIKRLDGAKKPIKNKSLVVTEIIGYIFLAGILLLGVFMVIEDPKAFFAQPEEGVRIRGEGKYLILIIAGVFYVILLGYEKMKTMLKGWKEKISSRRG